ncbi:annexin [Holotrichia oblita]|uniref:Annexin n=1 Tax=Holotrichia oblita TaxID=644536 RepID=A0ACB9TWW7_HOLOL|nr:annexin [Holotrichia oblita]
MKGLGTDEDTIIDILTSRCNTQRQQIAKFFKDELGRDLIDDLKSELGGHFEDVIVALVLPPDEYLCKQLHKAMEGMGTNEDTLIEIICSKTNSEMKHLVDTYERMYERPLTEHLCSETGGNLRRLLTLISTGTRDDSKETNRTEAREKAEALYADGEGRFGTHESTFGSVLAHENFKQLQLIFEEYKDVSGNTIEQALNHELSGDYLEALLAIVEYIQSPPAYFAARVYKAMHGLGTDDTSLIRIIVSRSEIDLGDIKDEFERLYDKTLSSYIDQGETTGDYKKALLAIIK